MRKPSEKQKTRDERLINSLLLFLGLFIFIFFVFTIVKDAFRPETYAETVAKLAKEHGEAHYVEIAPGGGSLTYHVWENDDYTVTYRASPRMLELENEDALFRDQGLDDELDHSEIRHPTAFPTMPMDAYLTAQPHYEKALRDIVKKYR